MRGNHQSWIIIYIFLFFCSGWLTPLTAQDESPYQLKWWRETGTVVQGIAGTTTAILLKQRKPVLTDAQIRRLDINNIPAFDRYPTQFWSPPAQKASDVFMYSAMIVPAFLLADKKVRHNLGPVSLIAFETYLLSTAITSLTKELFQRSRPFVYNPEAPYVKKKGKDATSSFISGHTSIVATTWFMTAKMYSDFNPNGKLKPYLWTTAILVPAITGYLRVRGGKHFPTDVIAGYLVGAAIGVLVPQLHKKRRKK